jgi:acetyl esterase/lipase
MSTPWRTPPPPIRLGRRDALLRRLAPVVLRLPPLGLRGAGRENARGDRLDPQVARMLWMEARVGRVMNPEDARIARASMRRGVALMDGPTLPVDEVDDLLVAGDLPARRYAMSGGPRPLLMFLHGGGWVAGDLETHDRFCRRVAREADAVVVAVDYRLAPEHPFPQAIDDAERAWADVARRAASLGADPDRLAVGGDSAGGNLSAVLCQRQRDGAAPGPTPALQVLIYPATDFRREAPSHREFATGLLLTEDSITKYKAHYSAPDDLDPRVSPLLHPDLSQLPPAIVATAGFDPLRDEGESYAEALQAAGVPVERLDEAGLVHGYLQLDHAIPAAHAAVTALLAAIRRGLSSRR